MEWINKMILFILLFSILQLIVNFLNNNKIIENDGILNNLRSYFESNSFYHLKSNKIKRYLDKNDNNITSNPKNNLTIVDYGYQNSYYFLNNISSYQYQGIWNNSIPTNFFQYNTGKLIVSITKNNTSIRNFIENIEKNEVLYFSILIFDGQYIDHWMNFTFNLHLKKDFSKEVNTSDVIKIESEITLSRIIGEFNDHLNYSTCENAKIIFDFYRKPKFTMSNNNFSSQSIEFSEIKGNLISNDCLFDIAFNLEIKNEEKNRIRIWNYSLILSGIAIVEIYVTLKLIYAVSENNTLGRNISLITICLNIIWNSFICTIHFFLSITYDKYSFDFGLPSMIYFLLFSIFELRLLFFIWKSRYYNLFFNNNVLFRKKLIKFYSMFYSCLFISLISMKHLFSNDLSIIIFFTLTWIPQIIHNIQNASREPLNLKYILVISFGKLFVPFYIRGCPYNVFLINPKPKLLIFVSLSIVIEVIILYLQKVFGPKCIIPFFLRKRPYNYYVDINDKECSKYNTDCIICLESFKKTNFINNNECVINIQDTMNKNLQIVKIKDFQNESNSFSETCFRKISQKYNDFLKFFKNSNYRMNHMLTPCKHLFHSDCLEKWIINKLECPCCRNIIPSLE